MIDYIDVKTINTYLLNRTRFSVSEAAINNSLRYTFNIFFIFRVKMFNFILLSRFAFSSLEQLSRSLLQLIVSREHLLLYQSQASANINRPIAAKRFKNSIQSKAYDGHFFLSHTHANTRIYFVLKHRFRWVDDAGDEKKIIVKMSI